MANWLVKSDPDDYGAPELERDGSTAWDGVRNPVAQRHIQAMSPGDRVFLYHSGKDKAVVAIAKVASEPRPDTDDKAGKAMLVDLEFSEWLPAAVTLKAIKADGFFEDFALVRQSRLSVMPVTGPQWDRIRKMAGLR